MLNIKKYWWLFVLIFIFLFSYGIRAQNIVPDKLLSFDPIFQYRYTFYVANFGHLPAWDELTYYVGRLVEINTSPPLMLYVTAAVYWIVKSFGLSLLTVAAYMSAIYGALLVFPSFLLGKELSNEYGGLLAAMLAGSAPQILVRTFGSSYDTDQVVLFFLIFTLYAGFHALKKKTISSYCLALVGFSGFLMTWGFSFYSYFILLGFVLIYFIMNTLIKGGKTLNLAGRIKHSFLAIKDNLIFLVALLIGIGIFAFINGENIIYHINAVVGFAQRAEEWIVNVSIAELQPFSIFSLEGWITSMGRFVTGDSIIDISLLAIFMILIAAGFLTSYKKRDVVTISILLTLFLIGIYTTFRGIRFTEFTSILFIILIGAGFGGLSKLTENDAFKRTIVIGLAIFIGLIAISVGSDMGKNLGPDVSPNWDSAWNFLKTQTPELSIVGTWWDPGHMITGLADRRVIADGAHCHNQCMYTINDRIVDLGKIMVTTDENESLSLIRKYQGDSPNVYWIASDDLIGKFQWLQYFGTGCDARVDQKCPLYIQLGEQSRSADQNGNIVLRNYGVVSVFQGLGTPIPIYIQDINGMLFDETIYYSNNTVKSFKLNDTEREALIQILKPLESQLNFRFVTNQTVPMTVWIPQHYAYLVAIPPSLRESVFTKMFMLEGQGLDHFKQVFRNEQVKIYEVI